MVDRRLPEWPRTTEQEELLRRAAGPASMRWWEVVGAYALAIAIVAAIGALLWVTP